VKKIYPFGFVIIFLVLVSLACDLSMPSNLNADKTKNALAVEQTKLAIMQSAVNQPAAPITNQNPPVTPTFTSLPPTQSPTQTTTYQALPGFSNYSDDFTDPNSGWPEKTSGENRYWYATDHYHIQVDRTNTQFVIPSGYMMANGSVIIYGLIPDQTSSPQAYFGAVCRYQDADNYYFFEISYDGFYRIGKVWNGVFSLIGMGAAKSSTAINLGDYNQIKAECCENELSLHINDTFIETVYDNTFTAGDTGLCASASDVPGIISAFKYIYAEEY